MLKSRLKMLEEEENRMDLDAARAALKEKGNRVKWSKLKKELDLQAIGARE